MKKQTFKISNKIIWSSSILVSILMSIPKIAERHFNLYETVVNFVLTTLFSLFVWYFNIYTLPTYSKKDIATGFSVGRMIKNLVIGFLIMLVLASLQQFILSHLPFTATVVMVEVRGVLIGITFYMFIHLLYQSYHNQQVSIELERSKMDNLGAQYELLKQQVNPHFLFNSLNTLKYMVESRDEHTVEFVLKLSDFYRFTLESRKLNLIKVSEELKILESYVYLLKARFEEGIDLSITVDPQVHQTYIPPFTLQLLVENCIKHNVVSLERPLQVKVYSEGDYIVVQNQIQLKRTPEASTGMGLENINQRYTHMLDKKIIIEPTEQLFTVKLPVIHENSHY